MDPRLVNDEIRGRAITFIPQDPWSSLSPLFTVGTQIMDLMKWKSPRRGGTGARGRWPALVRGYPRARRRADREAVLESCAPCRSPSRSARSSGCRTSSPAGQRQRLMIAMALLPRPDLIIADEPTTALDVTIQAQILRLLRDLVKERGVSVLFTTHDLGTAYEICDRIVVMYAGQEMESAPTDAFFERPAHPLYAAIARQPADRRRRDPRHPGRGAEPDRAAAGVPLPSAMRLCDRGVPGAPAGRARRRRRAPRALLSPAERRVSEPRAAPLLEVVDLARHFPIRNAFGLRTGSIRAVDGVSLAVWPGETLGLVGESGCGKSTLGKTLMGIHGPTAGEIRFGGREIGGLGRRERRSVARDLQYVYQDPGASLDPRWKVRRLAPRAAPDPHGAVAGRAPGPGRGDAAGGRLARRASRPLSARAVRADSSGAWVSRAR